MTWITPHTGHPTAREGIASAVVVAGRVYLVDCGMGVARQLRLAQLGNEGDFAGFETLQAIFLTHLHSDHTMDYFNIPLTGWYQGRPGKPAIEVYGPGSRGVPAPIFGDGDVPVVNPDNPTPGIEDMTKYFIQAFATDINDRMRDSRKPDIHTLLNPHDVMPPAGVVRDPNVNTHPRMKPFKVMEDDYVRVTATLVDHGAVYPAYAFRFDTDDGSIVFGGDTAPSPNLIRLAKDADILVHEVIDADWVRSLYGQPPYTPEEEAFIQHLLYSHTSIEQVGPVAEKAGVNTLVLSHLAPANNPIARWRRAKAGFSGRLVIGEDLLQLPVKR
ncbi:MBL fold metallo-hydrolase [Segeticoccus rhizosphaerae]|jgi:ribonuclease BN (tRNA processing enzyme)|uniref:MBL fold metallo-hydrolase n=1 Tax=Segeticoccus rhizosphaerae TaxID=1104777 RepID=UPI001EE4075F|nr:MBL fold metallo-hydrolase [Ornithinicoccus soli]